MTTPDFPDWQSPVGLVDRAALLGASPYTLNDGVAGPVQDVSAHNSICVVITTSTQGVVGVRNVLAIAWREAGNVVAQDTLAFHSMVSYTGPGFIVWQLPVRGGSFIPTLYCSTGGKAEVTFIGSTRDLVGGRQIVSSLGIGRVSLDLSFGSLAAGATSATVYVPPVAEKILLRPNQRIATVQTTVRAPSDIGAWAGTAVAVVLGTDVAAGGAALYVPGTGLELSMTNNDTVAHTCSLAIMDAST